MMMSCLIPPPVLTHGMENGEPAQNVYPSRVKKSLMEAIAGAPLLSTLDFSDMTTTNSFGVPGRFALPDS